MVFTPRNCTLSELLVEEEIDKYFCVYFDEGRYWGHLLKVFTYDEENDSAERVEIKFLCKRCEAWDFPSKEDQQIIESKFAFMGLCKPQELMQAGYFFDDEKASLLYKYIKSKK